MWVKSHMVEMFILEMGDSLGMALIFIFGLILVKIMEDMGIIDFPV
jgi:hypothetical protein